MSRLHVDRCLRRSLLPFLIAAGHDTVCAGDIGMRSAEDHEHLLRAAQEGRVLPTGNGKDFNLLHGAWLQWGAAWGVQPLHLGIVIVPQNAVSLAIARIVDELLRREDVSLPNALCSWDEHWYVGFGRWRQPLPDGGDAGTAPA